MKKRTCNRNTSANNTIRNVRIRSNLTSSLTSTTTTCSSCNPCTTPETGCSLYSPTVESGFPGSAIEKYGGTNMFDPSTCQETSECPDVPDHSLGFHNNVSGSADCPNDGDILIYREGSNNQKSQWVTASLEDLIAAQTSRNLSLVAPRSISQIEEKPIGGGSNVYGNGSDGDKKLNSDIILGSDVYYKNLDLNGFNIDTNGYRIFVSNSLTSTFNKNVSRIFSSGNEGTLGNGGLPNSNIKNSISGAHGSDGKRKLGNCATVSENDGGLGIMNNINSILPGRNLSGKKLRGGAGGFGDEAGRGGDVIMIVAKNIDGYAVIDANGKEGKNGSGGGGGGAIIIVSQDQPSWSCEVNGGDRYSDPGQVYYFYE